MLAQFGENNFLFFFGYQKWQIIMAHQRKQKTDLGDDHIKIPGAYTKTQNNNVLVLYFRTIHLKAQQIRIQNHRDSDSIS